MQGDHIDIKPEDKLESCFETYNKKVMNSDV